MSLPPNPSFSLPFLPSIGSPAIIHSHPRLEEGAFSFSFVLQRQWLTAFWHYLLKQFPQTVASLLSLDLWPPLGLTMSALMTVKLLEKVFLSLLPFLSTSNLSLPSMHGAFGQSDLSNTQVDHVLLCFELFTWKVVLMNHRYVLIQNKIHQTALTNSPPTAPSTL